MKIMTKSFLQGFNSALIGVYKNPYSDKKDAKNFMEYHNGHNLGSWHKRGNDDLKPLTEKEAISILQWLADEYINAPIYDILIKINKLPI